MEARTFNVLRRLTKIPGIVYLTSLTQTYACAPGGRGLGPARECKKGLLAGKSALPHGVKIPIVDYPEVILVVDPSGTEVSPDEPKV